MSLTRITKTRGVRGITDLEKAAIRLFMQGAIYSWINVNGEARFAVRDLMGGPTNIGTARRWMFCIKNTSVIPGTP